MNTPRDRYAPPAIVLHWISALLIVWIGTLGLLHDSWPDKASQTFWINMHAVSGLLLVALTIARLGWRLRHPPPPLPADAGAAAARWSTPVHRLLYVLLFALPLLGVVTFVWHGRVFDFWLFRIDPGVKSNRAIFHPTEDVHGYLAYALFGLAGLHIVIALWHRFARRDGVFARMWPGARG